MRWLVGIDFNDRCSGALHMAAWMRGHARTTSPQEFVAVHVLPERLRRMMVREATLDAPAMAVDSMRRAAADSGVGDPFSEFRADWALSADEGLALAAATGEATGILVGRASGVEDSLLAHLGGVARRLLRRLPAPVMVIPPDLTSADIGHGPIVLATDLDSASISAAGMASRLSLALDRELILVNVEETLRHVPAFAPEAYIPLTLIKRRTAADVLAWMSGLGLDSTPMRARVAEGRRVSALLDAARECGAPLIVCGSRCLSLPQRIFASSTASELARRGDRAVLVVPADPSAEISP